MSLCTQDGCDQALMGRGMCQKHYARAYRAGLFGQGVCTLDGCNDVLYARGMCSVHYQRERKYGDPHHVVCIQGDNEARFWSNVEKGDGCWRWLGAPDVYGYGRLRVADKQIKAHRFSYELIVGPIPEGLTIDHLCRNRMCVNPAHLEPVTGAENARRAQQARTA